MQKEKCNLLPYPSILQTTAPALLQVGADYPVGKLQLLLSSSDKKAHSGNSAAGPRAVHVKSMRIAPAPE